MKNYLLQKKSILKKTKGLIDMAGRAYVGGKKRVVNLKKTGKKDPKCAECPHFEEGFCKNHGRFAHMVKPYCELSSEQIKELQRQEYKKTLEAYKYILRLTKIHF